jgi:Na+/H+ antiporter NhaD/arsenite permease-like protein
MATMLIFSALIPFTIVIIFTLYACFWDKLASYREASRSAAQLKLDKRRASTDKKGFVELVSCAACVISKFAQSIYFRHPSLSLAMKLQSNVLVLMNQIQSFRLRSPGVFLFGTQGPVKCATLFIDHQADPA